jgi:hypothetical protein
MLVTPYGFICTRQSYKLELPSLPSLVKAYDLPISDEILEIRQLECQQVRFVSDLLEQCASRMILSPSQHLLDIIYY